MKNHKPKVSQIIPVPPRHTLSKVGAITFYMRLDVLEENFGLVNAFFLVITELVKKQESSGN
jgi:hypothetical protein